MFKTVKLNKSAFTLIELLVVIAIIGIISTLAVVSLVNARQSARDAKRIADIKQIQTALELYYQDNGEYPSTIVDSIATSGNIYMQSFPTAPTPADGDCGDADNNYTYTSLDGSNYTIEFCIGSNVGELSKGLKVAVPGGIRSWTCGNDLKDSRDSNIYPTVKIGTQCWMAKNLAYLPEVNNTEWQAKGANSSPAYGVYNYNGSDITTAKNHTNYITYGVLYNHFAAIQPSICPTGWHIPSEAEFNTLIVYLGGAGVAGGKMKETGITHWTSPNEGATNESGFTALPGGNIYIYGNSVNYQTSARFWSSLISGDNARHYSISNNATSFLNSDQNRTIGYSIRCLQD